MWLFVSNQNSLLCEDSHCISPPDPPADKFLKKQFNSLAPPAHGESVMYICDAGPNYNRFVDNFNIWNFTITCSLNNTFEEEPDIQWPTCSDGRLHDRERSFATI